MDNSQLIVLCFAIAVIAFLYSSVGHAGASGYIATMTLFGLAATEIRPTALVLNILVAMIGSFQFWRAGHFAWKLFWPFAVLSIPAAYRRLSATVCFCFENPDWPGAALFGGALDFSAQRSAGRRASSQSDSDRCWSGNRIPVRPHWNGRRNISHSPSAVLPLGAHSPGGRSLGVIYFGKLNFGANRLLYREPIYSVAWSSPRTRGGDWRRSGFTSRQPPFSHPHHLDLVGDSPGHRRTEVALHKIGRLTQLPAGAVR